MTVTHGGKPLDCRHEQRGTRVSVTLAASVELAAGQTLEVRMQAKG
ncbi:MAG: hypothetical protein ABSG68_26445 [Thermoguttaceae bacterium]